METFENDLEAIEEVFGDVNDDRYTPIIPAVVTPGHNAGQNVIYNTLLDSKTRAMETFKNHYVPEFDDVIKKYMRYSSMEDTNTTTVIMCKCLANKHPCDEEFDDIWTDETVWIWLDSEQLCHEELIDDPEHGLEDFEPLQHGFHKRCDDKVRIAEVVVEDTYTDHSASLELMVKVDEAFPGQINQETMYRIKKDWNGYLNGELDEPYDPITMTVIGESVSTRIGKIWNNFCLMTT